MVCTEILRRMLDSGTLFGANDRGAARELLDGIDLENNALHSQIVDMTKGFEKAVGELTEKVRLLEAEVEEYHGVMQHNEDLKKLVEERRKKDA
jgi:hypothetical protein